MPLKSLKGDIILTTSQKGVGFTKLTSGADAATRAFAGLAAAGVATGVAVAFVGKSIKTFAKFDKAISDLSAITGAAGKELDFYANSARELGKTSIFTASQVADAYRIIASAKPELLDNKEALEEVTKQTLLLAEAAGLDVPRAAEVVTQALNQYSAAADQTARFVNVLAAGSLKGAASVAQTSEALRKVGVVARFAGISFEQTTASIQLLFASMGNAQEVGTQFRGVLLRLANQSNSQFNPEIVGLTQAFRNLRDAGLSSTEMTRLFGQEGITAGRILLNEVENIDKLTGAITGTNSAMEQAARRMDNLEGDLIRLSSAWQELEIVIGEKFNPTARRAVTRMARLALHTAALIDELHGGTREWGNFDESIRRFEAYAQGTVDLFAHLSIAVFDWSDGYTEAHEIVNRRTADSIKERELYANRYKGTLDQMARADKRYFEFIDKISKEEDERKKKQIVSAEAQQKRDVEASGNFLATLKATYTTRITDAEIARNTELDGLKIALDLKLISEELYYLRSTNARRKYHSELVKITQEFSNKEDSFLTALWQSTETAVDTAERIFNDGIGKLGTLRKADLISAKEHADFLVILEADKQSRLDKFTNTEIRRIQRLREFVASKTGGQAAVDKIQKDADKKRFEEALKELGIFGEARTEKIREYKEQEKSVTDEFAENAEIQRLADVAAAFVNTDEEFNAKKDLRLAQQAIERQDKLDKFTEDQVDQATQDAAMLALEKKHNAEIAALDDAAWRRKKAKEVQQLRWDASVKQAKLGFARVVATGLADIAGVSGKKLFLIHKGFAIAEAVVAKHLAIAVAAASAPPPFNAPAIAAATAIGTYQIAAIAATAAFGLLSSSGGGSGGSSVSASVPAIPDRESSLPDLSQDVEGTGVTPKVVEINITGLNAGSRYTSEELREIIEGIVEEVGDGATLNFA